MADAKSLQPTRSTQPASKHALYRVWSNMRRRCSDPKCVTFKHYGGRGIRVCERWQKSFWDFVADMGDRPDGAEIDRIDTNGNYEPSNCRWATRAAQLRNMRSNVWYELNGEKVCMADFARAHGLSPELFRARLKLGWPLEKVLSKPVEPGGGRFPRECPTP